MRRAPRILGLAALLLPIPAPAQTGEPSSRADSLFAAESWAEAATAYEALVTSDPANGQAWYRLGHSRYQLEAFGPAAEAWRRAADAGFAPAFSNYNAASARARLGDADAAFAALEAAEAAGLAQPDLLAGDADFDAVRDDPRYAAIHARMEAARFPCRSGDVYERLDFWLGTWDVFDPQGQRVGRNVLEKDYGGCTVIERWEDAFGGRGTSLNWWDPALGQWVQRWVSDNGRLVQIEGNLKGDSMVLHGHQIDPAGAAQDYRMTITPNADGSVRQRIETSDDGGATWTTGFDGRYVRIEAERP
ncbi:MAG TPA: tetratricopeptide repeat protein [Gemmatimonadota bacterium]|nr:tetratricopeptide repeat protein [Gemmatimonadota bacterium]